MQDIQPGHEWLLSSVGQPAYVWPTSAGERRSFANSWQVLQALSITLNLGRQAVGNFRSPVPATLCQPGRSCPKPLSKPHPHDVKRGHQPLSAWPACRKRFEAPCLVLGRRYRESEGSLLNAFNKGQRLRPDCPRNKSPSSGEVARSSALYSLSLLRSQSVFVAAAGRDANRQSKIPTQSPKTLLPLNPTPQTLN